MSLSQLNPFTSPPSVITATIAQLRARLKDGNNYVKDGTFDKAGHEADFRLLQQLEQAIPAKKSEEKSQASHLASKSKRTRRVRAIVRNLGFRR